MYDINQKWTEMKRSWLNREITFTDNCDFITEDPREKTKSREVSAILKTGNPLANDVKKEITTLKRSSKETEIWRKTKKLKSLLGVKEDIEKKEKLGNVAVNKMSRIWGLTIQDEKELDRHHRNHLKIVLRIK